MKRIKVIIMANLQVKGMDDRLYEELKKLAAAQNRSVSQEVIFLLKSYFASQQALISAKTPAEVLLQLAGSWVDERESVEIVKEIRAGRKNSKRRVEF